MNIRKTQAWEAAEHEHTAMTADQMMPLLGGQLTLEQKIGRYEQILEKCPQFYPALLEMRFCELQMPEKNSADQFIFKFADVDSRMIEEIYATLFEYYGFLAQKRMVSALEFQQFQNEALEIKQELLEKMQKYNAVRHDESINENNKEAIRDEIFEGDHAWPFI